MRKSDWAERIAKAVEARASLGRDHRTTAFRVVNGEGDQVPDVTLDWFDGVAVLSLYRDLAADEEDALLEAIVATLRPKAIYLKLRPKEARVAANTRRGELAPEQPARGDAAPELTVRENGLQFAIRPAQGLSVGLYLDMRDTRAWVREFAGGRTVLNCFSYTCAFSVAAAAGGALRTLNIDLSRRVLDWGKGNAALNQQARGARDYLAGDVFEWVSRLAGRGERFGLVILDPPSFATARGKPFSAASDTARLAEVASAAVAPGGALLACCNAASLSRARFERMVEQGIEACGRSRKLIRRLEPSKIDFPVVPGGEPALKAVAWELA